VNHKKTIGNNQPKQMSRQYYTQKEKEKKKDRWQPTITPLWTSLITKKKFVKTV